MTLKAYDAEVLYMQRGNCGYLVFLELSQFCSLLKIHEKPSIKSGHWEILAVMEENVRLY